MVNLLNWLFIMLMFFGGVSVFCSSRKLLLAVLLRLVFIILSLFLGLILYLNTFSYEVFFSMVFLTFSVCEGALGSSILVSMVCTLGNDFFKSFSILQC